MRRGLRSEAHTSSPHFVPHVVVYASSNRLVDLRYGEWNQQRTDFAEEPEMKPQRRAWSACGDAERIGVDEVWGRSVSDEVWDEVFR